MTAIPTCELTLRGILPSAVQMVLFAAANQLAVVGHLADAAKRTIVSI